tara:strand:- start:1528 stop:2577 length:1050 start_codon:yes stop_codon:yes gene_type:complete
MVNFLIHKNKTGKQLPNYSIINLPSYVNIPKYTKFKNFLENNVDKVNVWPSCDNQDIGALEVTDDEVSINPDRCIGCLMCLSTKKDLRELELQPARLLEKLYPVEIIDIIKNKNIFSGSILKLPYYKDRKTNTFEQYTSYKETTHISLWATSILNFLSSDPNSRMGKEIEIMKMDNPRDGRLDICINSNDSVFVGEAKVDLNSAITENRYRIQIPSYQKECQRFIDAYNKKFQKNKKLFICLVMGGEETDLLPTSHAECSSITGNKSKRFYDDIIKHNIKFISANALLTIALHSVFHKKRLAWDKLVDNLFNHDVVGLVTAGLVHSNGGNPIVKPIDRKIIISSEQPFS